jgi:sugar-specific transcriptional regulator TrmB
MNKTQALINLGLSEPEASVYIGLLELGGATAGVASKHLNINRTTLYGILDSLVNKGFAQVYYRKTRHYYYAQKPQRVISLVEEKLHDFTQLAPFLESLSKKQFKTTGLQFIQTKQELKQFYLGKLREIAGKEYWIIGTEAGWSRVDPAFLKRIHQLLASSKIKTKIIFAADTPRLQTIQPDKMRQTRYLPKGYSFQSTIDIFPDSIFIATPHLEALGVVIAIPAMIDVFRVIFKLLWENVAVPE